MNNVPDCNNYEEYYNEESQECSLSGNLCFSCNYGGGCSDCKSYLTARGENEEYDIPSWEETNGYYNDFTKECDLAEKYICTRYGPDCNSCDCYIKYYSNLGR